MTNVPWQKFSKSRVWDKVPDRVPLFLMIRYPNFLITQGIKRPPKASMLKINSICSTVLIKHGLVTDRWTDRQKVIAKANTALA